MKLMRLSFGIFGLAFLVLVPAKHSSGQEGKKSENKEIIAHCNRKLIKNSRPQLPNKWSWGTNENYPGHPVVSYTVEADGTVTNLKLKRSSGVRKIDEYILRWVKKGKFEAKPGCPRIDTTETIIIDFQ